LSDDGGRSRAGLAWIAFAASLGIVSSLVWALPSAGWATALEWRPAQALSQPWRWWSAAFVHLSLWHLVANLAGCVVVAAFGAAARLTPRAAWAWCAAWPLTHLGLALRPALTSYGGLSGLLHAGVVIAAVKLIGHDRGLRRVVGMAVLAGLILKVTLERPWAAVTVLSAAWDFPVAPLAHATGALAGLVCGSLALVRPTRGSIAAP